MTTMSESSGPRSMDFRCPHCFEIWTVDGYATNGMWDPTAESFTTCPNCGEEGECDE